MAKSPSRIDLVIILCAVALGVVCITLGVGQTLDLALRQARDALHGHNSSGDLAVIEIDSKSLAAINHWPWPRRTHAQLANRLSEDGVRIAAFDVDFSTPSNSIDDRLFADALAHAKGAIVLPTFRQQRSSAGGELFENVPIAAFRQHAFLGAVNIFVDDDGQVRRYLAGVVTDKEMRPSVAALLAESSSVKADSYAIDLSIDPTTIPRYSYVDVLNGRIPRSQLVGKRVLIGATAIEIGDRYPVPGHGVLPGVIIQALAAETLMQGSVNNSLGGWPMLLAAGGLMLSLLRKKSLVRCVMAFGGGFGIALLLPLLLEILKIGTMDVAPSLLALTVGGALLGVRHIQQKFHQNRMTDVETGLPNNAALVKKLKNEPSIAVATARIQHFSEVSSLISREQKAELLTRIADRLKLTTRLGIIYRVEENAFAWPMANGDHQNWADQFAALSAIFNSSIHVGGRAIELSPTFGVAEGQAVDPTLTIALALLAADRAMQQGIRWDIHNTQHARDLDWKLSLLGELDEALSDGNFWLAYQPKSRLRTGEIIGAEALVRWSHKTRGAIAPDHFIPAIEAAGRIHDLTIYVIKAVLAQLERWAITGQGLSIAVNISASLLGQRSFIAHVIAMVRAAHVDPSNLTLEITESAALADPENAIGAMHELRDLGLRISIDDYGTGLSTLSYLKRLPANEIKIDKCFITNILHDNNDQILVRSTISMAHELGFQVVAEGIEDTACMALLDSLDCDTGQGWAIGKPMPISDFNALVAGERSQAA